METLFNGLATAFPKESLSQICRCGNDLATFLKMHSNTFFVQANMNVTGRLLRNTRVVVSVREARQLVSAILAARQPVSFDGEGVNLGPSGPMTLLQVGLVSGQIYIFDVMVERSLMYEGGLRELLESTDIVKVSVCFTV
ncbi:hypothetical protein E2C01_101057 [Portunus trituberculatus]|uniref:Egal-1 winged helix domain-containing protein n=1 Tax=Portunus trituberculatus TaxID=210409 RepID=A0A5B7K8K3_PORTR|nr:hypothetical protein [Portunus trituberculatus]